MGPYPFPLAGGGTSRTRLNAMVANTTSVEANVWVIPDLVPTTPAGWGDPQWSTKHRGLVAMRTMAEQKAKEWEYDYLLIVENDLEVPLDLLDKLVAHGKDVTVPRLDFPMLPIAKGVHYSPVEQNGQTGLMLIQWCGFPCTLYRMAAFDFKPMFIGGGEGKDYTHWQEHGISAYMDLDTVALVLELPMTLRVAFGAPGNLKMHHRLGKNGNKIRCDGTLITVAPKRHPEALATTCTKCSFYVEYRPPAMFRGELLSDLDLLGRNLDREEEPVATK